MSKQSLKNRRNRYKIIDEDKRLQIIDRIIKKGEQLKSVSEDIGINVSTCKAIVKVYQEEGRVGKKKTRNKVVDVVETYSFYVLENSKLTQICPLKILNSKISVENKQLIEDTLEDKCKQKAQKMLMQAVQTHKKVQQAMRQTQPSIPDATQSGNYFHYGFFPQI